MAAAWVVWLEVREIFPQDRLLELEWEEEEEHKAEWHATIHSLQCAGTFLYPTFLTHFAKIVGHKPRVPLPPGCP